MHLRKVTEEMFRFYFQIILRAGIQKIFVFEIFESCSDSKTQVLIPYVREAEFSRMVLISGIISTVTMIVDIDIIIFEEVAEIEVPHLHRFQGIIYAGSISFPQTSGYRYFRRDMCL